MAAGMAETPPARCYRFGEFTLSPARRSLRREGREVPLIPRYLDLLILLVEHRAEALRRQEIFDRVWSDVVVSDGALTQAIRTLRRTLGEDGGGGFIRTVSRHGYQFVCPVSEGDDADESASAPTATTRGAPGSAPDSAADLEGPPGDPFDPPLDRLLDPGSPEEVRREAAEDLHRLGTAEALRRIDRRHGHARAWAHLRDSRWEVPGAGPVPLLGTAAGPAGWGALASLRLRQVLRLVGARWAAASLGGAIAGTVAGLLGGFLMTLLPGAGLPPSSLLLGLGLVGALMGGLGAAGVGSGLAAAEALVRSWRTPALVVLGAVGGGLVGALARRLADALVEAIFAVPALDLAGGVEGAVIGAAAGLGYGLSTSRLNGGMVTPHGTSRLRVNLATGLACAVAAGLLCAGGFRLGAASLQSVVAGFPDSKVRFEAFATLMGETDVGRLTRAALGATEGLLFGVGLATGLTRRPRRRAELD
jgi:DNA-binding winged helix-turn-helix (wHTH) protein